MLAIIFEVTEKNEIITLIPASGDVYLMKLNQDDADFYRRELKKECMIRRYFNKIPGKIIGQYIQMSTFYNTKNKSFYFIPARE